MSIYFLTAHKSTEFPDDANPPTPGNSIRELHYELYDDLIFGKRITQDDVALMVKNNTWTSGTVYNMYDDQASDLADKNFYVVSQEGSEYHIFKCLNNNNGAQSVDQPLRSETEPDDEYYRTSDGYQWKYMYKLSISEYRKWATANYVPVVIDGAVEDNAVDGAIETIVIESPGDRYNSYAYGSIKEATVVGNRRLFSIQSDDYTDVLVFDFAGLSGAFNTGIDVQVLYEGEVIGFGSVYSESSTTLRVINYSGSSVTTNDILEAPTGSYVLRQELNSILVAQSTLIGVARVSFPNLSANTDFYKNSSFYIRSGKGAGQLRTVAEYIVTGDERRVLIDIEFDVVPDTTSRFEITPRVIIRGDGSDCEAIAKVATTANVVSEIEILNRGSGYTYANVEIIANTGVITINDDINTDSAVARAIISPPGGHGSNIPNELYCRHTGIGMVFANTELGTIPTANDYRKIGIIKDPLFANANILISESVATDFTAGEGLGQANTGAIGEVSGRFGNVLTLTNIRGFFETGSNTVNYVTGLTSGQQAVVESIDRSFDTFDQRQIYQVEVTDPGPSQSGFVEDEKVTQVGTFSEGYVHEVGNAVKLVINGELTESLNDPQLNVGDILDSFIPGERVIQADTGAEATLAIVNIPDNYLVLKDVTGTFEAGTALVNVVQGAYSEFSVAIDQVTPETLLITLADVVGNFAISDSATDTINTFVGETSGATAVLYGRDYTKNYLVDNSGEFVYIENTIPIERSDDQSERIKVIVEF